MALPDAAERHLVCCSSCREFREQSADVALALAAWDAPPASDRARERVVAACQAVVLDRLARSAAPSPARARFSRARHLFQHPALLGVLGAAATAAAVAVAPAWVHQVAAGWAAGATVLASLVLLCHGRQGMFRGERI